SILTAVAGEIADAAGSPADVIELGSGSSTKTRTILDALLSREEILRYVPIDISADFLCHSAHSLIGSYPQLEVSAIAGEYTQGLRNLPERRGPRLFLFLGSNIGNFDPSEAADFLRDIRQEMLDGDSLLIGVDRLKDHTILEAAYTD